MFDRKTGKRVFVREMTRASGLIVLHSSRYMGGFMKKIIVIVRAPTRDFSPTRVAIHSFEINGKIVKRSRRTRERMLKSLSQIFPEYFLYVSSFMLRNVLKAYSYIEFNVWLSDSQWRITVDRYTDIYVQFLLQITAAN